MKFFRNYSPSRPINFLNIIRYTIIKLFILLLQLSGKLLLALLDIIPTAIQKTIKKIKIFYDNQETLDLVSITYLIAVYYLISNGTIYFANKGIIIISMLCSITLLAYGYSRYKDEIKIVLNHGVIKWIVTALIYTCCLLLARWTFNIDYKITPENLNYSIIGYAVFLTLPITALFFGLAVYAYIYVRKISLLALFFSSLLSIGLGAYFFKKIASNSSTMQQLIFLLMTLVIYQLLPIIFPRSRAKFGINEIIRSMTFLSVAISLIFIGVTSLTFIENNKSYFLFLDANVYTSCNKKDSHDFYIRKNDNDCYKLKLNTTRRVELIPINDVGS